MDTTTHKASSTVGPHSARSPSARAGVWARRLLAYRRRTEIPFASTGAMSMSAVVRATVSAMPTSAPTPDSVVLSGHAMLQYQQRVKPGLEPGAARAELNRLRSLGQISADAPHWLNAAKPAPYYLRLGDAIVLPLAPHADGWIATTCVTQRTLTPTRRSAKSARKASLRAGKRAQRRTEF
jgi:hypothetical protein